ncbi:MAG: FAD-dependent oxidoreductase [Lentisphaeria bacterium]|nr:FAD-dependent oxidoreductase [Lentisphaeria bacterium]
MGNEKYDVIVAGGGIAGVSAAVSAAKKGAKTLLLEKSFSVGGLATSGLINIFLPLCDGNGHQVTFGLTYELMKRSMIYGPGKVPSDWKEKKNAPEVERLRCVFSPASLILALEEFLLENGVEIRYDSLVTGMEKEGKLVKSLQVEDSDGRKTLEGKAFVDATGAAVLSKMAAEEVSFGKNVLSLWALEYEGSCQYGRDRMVPDINMLTRGNAERTFISPSAKDATDYILETRALLRKFYLQEYASGKTDRFRRWPLFLPGMPQFRKIAALKGKKELSDNMNNRFFEDSIGVVSDWRKSGPVWEIPFGTLEAPHTENLFAAGRCISSVGEAWEITRCIPCSGLTGEAAGCAAALFEEKERAFLCAKVQKSMAENGNILHWEEALKA